MKPTHIEHLGIAVTSLEEAMPFFEFLTGGKMLLYRRGS